MSVIWGALSFGGILLVFSSAFIPTQGQNLWQLGPILAGVGVLLAGVGLPFALASGKEYVAEGEDKKLRPVSGILVLLSERNGGLSLGRVQLLLWYAPALVMYTMVAIPTQKLVPDSEGWAMLLGLSGLVAAAASVGTPKEAKKEEKDEEPASKTPAGVPMLQGAAMGSFDFSPDMSPEQMKTAFEQMAAGMHLLQENALSVSKYLQEQANRGEVAQENSNRTAEVAARDLVEDFSGHLDLTRLQYLLFSLIGSAALVAAFVKGGTLTLPDIPKEFLYLAGGSQLAYVGTKAAKTLLQGDAPPAK